MLKLLLLVATSAVLLGSCAPYRNAQQERFLTLPQHYAQFDAKLAWEITSTDRSTMIDGVFKNVRYNLMDQIEVWVWALDENGKERNRAVSFVFDLKENETGTFTMELPKIASGTKLRFMYRYVAHEGGNESSGASNWTQTFDSAVL